MPNKYIATVERNAAIFNTEDRDQWYSWGENEENGFITHIVPHSNLDIRINPQKKMCSWAIDLIDYTNNRPADLKTPNTPFSLLESILIKVYHVILTTQLPLIEKIIITTESTILTVTYTFGFIGFKLSTEILQFKKYMVYSAAIFSQMALCIENGDAPLHPYMHRVNDDHNAKDSYVFNLKDEDVFEKVF